MPWFTAKALEDNPRAAHVVIDKPIGSDWAPDWISDLFGEQPAREFIEAVDALGELDEITVELNSPGGDVASGVRIYNYLTDHSAKIHTRVTGTAASIATVIMMAGDTRSMAVGSTMMTHRASALMIGLFNAREMTEMARNLETIDASMVDIYSTATGKGADEIASLLDQGDTYLGADEAVDWGFATEADAKLRAVACADPKLYMKQIEQQGEIARLKAQLKGKGDNATMTAAEALALAFDLTPEQAEAQAADLGDQIIALRRSVPGAVQSFEITAESLQDTHPDVVAAIKASALAEIGPAPNADEVLAGERTRVTAIVKACQTTGQTQLLDKLIDNGMPEDQASDYIYDVAAASGNRHSIHNSHSPEGGHRAGINYDEIYARQNRKTQA
ncbi:Clp protease ClpP [Halomonas elongata]|uniref:head maturation protease, ClpP-related n=1 Tax=Halomonas elongata TaxID=2746 RepID=UPI00255B079E|nr:head maturation protease, ClpP-related [Halomonas elongata]MDL4861441.1 Clp protease ClpP [Halomonas elongata]